MGKFMEAIGWIVFIVILAVVGTNVVYYTYKGVEATRAPGVVIPHVRVQPSTSATADSRIGTACVGQKSGKPGVWKIDAANGRLGCWVGQ